MASRNHKISYLHRKIKQKGFSYNVSNKTIYSLWNQPYKDIHINRLVNEYGYVVQLEIG